MTHPRLSRRGILAGAVAIVPSTVVAMSRKAGADVRFYIGTYSSDTAKGIVPLTYSRAKDGWTLGAAVPTIENASFGTWDAQTGRYYMLNEKDDGRVATYDRHWRSVGEVSSHGKNPCYISTDPTGRYAAVANYSSGNVVVYKTGPDGALLEPATIRQNAGTGPNTERQEGPHAHWAQFHEGRIYSVDLGTDQILGYSFDVATGKVGDAFTVFKAPAGSGPRHMLFHPNGQHAYVVTELSSQVITLKAAADGRFEQVAIQSTLPAGFAGKSFCAHIVLNKAADRLYVSNRGNNSIAVFKVAADGALSLLQIAPTLGDWPRFFLLREDLKRLVVAHQNGNTLVVFAVKPDGTLVPKNQSLTVSKPVFIGAMA